MKHLARLFILVGIAFYSYALYHIALRENPSRLSFDTYTYAQSETSSDTKQTKEQLPVRITSQAVGIDTPIYPAVVNNNVWETTKAGASYITTSPLPGQKGNSVMYGHNWSNIFGNLTKAKIGQEITVTFGNGTIETFEVAYISEVSPEASSILAPSQDNRLTLYTCSGFLDTKRYVVVAIKK